VVTVGRVRQRAKSVDGHALRLTQADEALHLRAQRGVDLGMLATA
jgi:hypothetical protein